MSNSDDFLAFRKMITPIIIQTIFWAGVVVCIMGGIVSVVYGIVEKNVTSLLYGLLFVSLGPLGVRIYCEILILFFRMNETLTEINNKLDSRLFNRQEKEITDTAPAPESHQTETIE